MHADAGIGRHADAFPLLSGLRGDLLLQVGGGLQQLMDGGLEPFPGGGQPHAGAVPDQKGESGFLFQSVHHMGQTG